MASAGKITNIVMRFFQFIFALTVLGLSAALIYQQSSPTSIDYSIFTAAFAVVSLFYLIPASFMESICVPAATVTLDALNFIFLLCAGIVMSTQLRGNNCSNWFYWGYNNINNNNITDSFLTRRCREANAMAAFEWFAAVAFLVSFGIGVHKWRKTGATADLGKRRPSAGAV